MREAWRSVVGLPGVFKHALGDATANSPATRGIACGTVR
jgi:hypothetical protein